MSTARRSSTWTPARLVGQIRAARDDQAALAARIRRGTSDYAEEVEALLEQVATESLGLQARPFRRAHDTRTR